MISNLFWTYVVVLFPGVWIFSFLERKLAADLQARVGPKRAGAGGFFQPLGDFLKTLQKEPFDFHSYEELAAAVLCWVLLGASVALLPLGSFALFLDSDLSGFLMILFFLLLSLALAIFGLSQPQVPSWLGASRLVSQTLTASLPVFIAFLCPVMVAGGLQWTRLAAAQSFSPLHWGIVATPFAPLAFGVFLLGGLILVQAAPSSNTSASGEIHEGVSTNLSSFRLALFRFSGRYFFFLWCLMTVVIFLGAWNLPEGLTEEWKSAGRERLLSQFELGVVLVKTLVLMLVCVWVGVSTTRGRLEQVTRFCWRVLSPIAILAAIGTAVWQGVTLLL